MARQCDHRGCDKCKSCGACGFQSAHYPSCTIAGYDIHTGEPKRGQGGSSPSPFISPGCTIHPGIIHTWASECESMILGSTWEKTRIEKEINKLRAEWWSATPDDRPSLLEAVDMIRDCVRET